MRRRRRKIAIVCRLQKSQHVAAAVVVVVVIIGMHERTENSISGRAERGRTRVSESPAVYPINTIGIGVASTEDR